MRRDERKSRVLQEWDHWVQTKPVDRRRPTARDTLIFFCELQDWRSPLLDFRAGGRDKWQIFHAWLLEEGRVSDSSTRSASRREPASQMGAAQNDKSGGKRRT